MAKYNSSEVGFLLIDGYAISGISTEINEGHKEIGRASCRERV